MKCPWCNKDIAVQSSTIIKKVVEVKAKAKPKGLGDIIKVRTRRREP